MSDQTALSSETSSGYVVNFEPRPLKFDRIGNFLSRHWHETFLVDKQIGQREFYSMADKSHSQWDGLTNSELIKKLQNSKPTIDPVVSFMFLQYMASRLFKSDTDIVDINLWRAYQMYLGRAVNIDAPINLLESGIAAAALVLDGKQVHLVYSDKTALLIARKQLNPFFNALKIESGSVDSETLANERHRQYQYKICFCLAQELVFDYLRDRLKIGSMTQGLRLQVEVLYHETPRIQTLALGGLQFALIADMDKVLMDAARAPLEITEAIDNNEDEKITLARLSYPGFFRRYEQLSGYGYLSEFKSELWETYRLGLMARQRQAAAKMKPLKDKVYYYQHEEDKWAALIEKVQRYLADGQSVYLSVELQASVEKIQLILEQAKITFSINNADNLNQQAVSISAAQVYLQFSDNILHARHDGILIFIEYTRARRRSRMIKDFIAATSSKQALLFVSPNDKGLSNIISNSPGLQMLIRILKAGLNSNTQIGNFLLHQLISIADKVGERMQAKTRRSLLQQEIQKGKMLSFAGRGE
ncbi:hypothetical protein MNBD_GAMMA25-1437 [hydrothermal vent metagenome]|uniref:SecA family profile domain-containing protein n=1 Tax=hydrothermal vent metagenome TaxID=652676 RepID=A0A3B1ALJ8_9ZZZZ